MIEFLNSITPAVHKDEILNAIKLWENVRQHGLFTEEQKLKLQDTKNEFHLQVNASGEYELLPVYNSYYLHEQKIKQPGEPTYSSFQFDNPAAAQPFAFIITMMNDKDSDPSISFDELSISINQQDPLLLPVNLKQKQILYCDGKTIKLYNNQWQLLQTIGNKLPALAQELNDIKFDGKYSGENGGKIKIEVRAKGTPETLK